MRPLVATAGLLCAGRCYGKLALTLVIWQLTGLK
jgi:hypothetical protein